MASLANGLRQGIALLFMGLIGAATAVPGPALAGSPITAADSSANAALSMLPESGSEALCVNDAKGIAVGHITMQALHARLARSGNND